MNKKHYLCTHTWIGEKERLESLASSEGMTDIEFFDSVSSEKAEWWSCVFPKKFKSRRALILLKQIRYKSL